MLPAEAVATFVFINGLILATVQKGSTVPMGYGYLCLGAVVLIAVGNIFYLRSTFRPGRDRMQDLVWTAVTTTIAFLLWTWLIGGAFWLWVGWTDAIYPQVLVAVFTFLAPTIPFVKKAGVTATTKTPKHARKKAAAPESVDGAPPHEPVSVGAGSDTALNVTAPAPALSLPPLPRRSSLSRSY
jgi:hypothetical protein